MIGNILAGVKRAIGLDDLTRLDAKIAASVRACNAARVAAQAYATSATNMAEALDEYARAMDEVRQAISDTVASKPGAGR
jgi:hypothetical protein